MGMLISYAHLLLWQYQNVLSYAQDASRDLPGEDQGQSSVKVMCRLCYFGENEGSERARKMLSCKSCGKKYHRSCLKVWAQNRGIIFGLELCLYCNFSNSNGLLQIYFIGVRGLVPHAEFVRQVLLHLLFFSI